MVHKYWLTVGRGKLEGGLRALCRVAYLCRNTLYQAACFTLSGSQLCLWT